MNRVIGLALNDLRSWMKKDLVRALVYGGFGIQGIADTPFYKFISSADGLSQLGIPATEPPKLLAAYEKTISVVKKGKDNQLELEFGNVARLKLATPHPAAGTGNLHIKSWLEWVVDNKKVESGYVDRNKLPQHLQQKPRLDVPLGGLMLPRNTLGSTGMWRFPQQLQTYEIKWFKSNISKIESAILSKFVEFLTQRANG